MKRKIKIGRRKYKIELVDKIRSRIKRKEKGITIGIIKPKQKIIQIKKIGKIINKQTLFHEIAHGIMIELTGSAYRASRRAKKPSNQNRLIRYSENFAKLNSDEEFIDYFGNLLNKTFKLK